MRGRMVGSLGAVGVMALTSAAFAQYPGSPSPARFDAPPPAPSAVGPVEPAPPQAAGAQAAAPGAPQPVGAPAAPAAPGSSTLATPSPGELPPTDAADVADVADNHGKPSSGLGMIIPGWILSGTGALAGLATALCYSDATRDVNGEPYPRQVKDICAGIYATVGVVSLSIGIPLLVVGYDRRYKYQEWRRRHPALGQLMRAEIAIGHHSALVVYRGSF